MKLDKKAIYTALEQNFPDPNYASETNSLCSHCLKLSEEWFTIEQNLTNKSKRELRKDLKQYISMNTNLRDTNSSYFVPSFIWFFIAGQIISWLVRYIIDKYTYGAD